MLHHKMITRGNIETNSLGITYFVNDIIALFILFLLVLWFIIVYGTENR